MRIAVRLSRGVSVVIVAGTLTALPGPRIAAQGPPLRWDGAIEHIGSAEGWGNVTGPRRMSRHAVSHDTRWVVFGADIQDDPTTSFPYLFRHDRFSNQTELFMGGDVPTAPVLSADGNTIAVQRCLPFWRPDNAEICDVWLLDFRNWMLTNVSTLPDGTLSTAESDEPVLSPDARFVVFRTRSSTLAAGAPGQIVLRDRDTDGNGVFDEPGGVTIEAISVSSLGEPANDLSESAEVSADGRFVAFRSRATNLVPGDTNDAWDVFLRDRYSGETRRINVGWGGQQATVTLDSPAIAISADGTLVAFATDDYHLTSPPTALTDTNNALDVAVFDYATNTLTRIDIGADGAQGNGHTYWPTFSADGRYVSLLSTSTNTGAPVTPGRAHAYVHDRLTQQTTRVSVAPDGSEPNADVSNVQLSWDGSYVLFLSDATNLTAPPAPGVQTVFGAAHFDVSPTSLTIPWRGGVATADVTAQQYVQWTGELSEYSWLQWELPSWGPGSKQIAVSAIENSDPTARTINITINSKTIAVTQEPGFSMSAIAPAVGPETGGTVVTITGTGFEPGITAYFHGLETPTEFVDSTTLRAVTPAHDAGMAYVWLRTADFHWASLYPGQFRFTDTTPPEVMPYAAGTLSETGWYTSNVAIDWYVHDWHSQITSSVGCAHVDVTTDTGGTTFTCTATSEGGTASASITVRRDTTPPVVNMSSPRDTIYTPFPARTVSYTCTDALSGVTNCTGDVASGQPLDMTPGFHMFGVSTTDAAGNPGYAMVNYAIEMGICMTRPAGLAAWWPFETSSGQTTYSSYKDIVSGIDATPVNTDNRFGQGAVGAFAMSTANVPSYLNAGTRPALAMTGSMTLSAWIFPTVDYDPNGAVIAGREGEYLVARFPDGTLRYSIANTSPGWGWVNTGHVIPRWVWSHVVLTYDGTAVILFVNGQAVHGLGASGPIGDAEPTLNEFRIGARQKPATPSYFVGGIDDVILLNRRLTSDEVQNMFLAGTRGLCGPRSLDLTLSPNPVRLTYGETQQVELVASLSDDGIPIVGRPITLTRFGETLLTGVTDDAGFARTTISVTGVSAGTSFGAYQANSPADLYYSQAHVFVAQITDKAVPQITWPAPAPIVYGSALNSTQLNATANTGGTFTYDPPAGTVLGAGTHTLTVNFQPWIHQYYTPASASVPITVMPATPSVQVTGGTFTYDGQPHGATATATGVSGPLTPVTITYGGSSQAPTNAGTYEVVATYAGDANHSAASATGTLTINKATPVVSATGGTFTYDATPHAATASASGVGGAALTPVTLTYNGSSEAPTNAGTYDVVATYAGDGNYTAASATTTVVINKATPVVSATGGTFTYDGTPHAASASAIGVGGAALTPVTLTYTGSPQAPTHAGTYDVVATYAGDVNYTAASATTTLVITRATPVVSANGGTFSYDGTAHGATASATGVGGAALTPVTLTYNGSPEAPTSAGTYDVVATFAGDANYIAASATTTLVITRATPVVSANGGTFTYDGASHGATASATGIGGETLTPVTITYDGSSTAPANAGAYAVVASFAGSTNYEAASATATVTIDKAVPTVTASGGTFAYDGAPHGATASATGVGGETLTPITITYDGSSTAPANAGTYAVVASFAGSTNYEAASATATVTIDKAVPTVTASGGTFTYDGAPHGATASATGAGGEPLTPVTITYDGSSTVPTNAGTYAVVASFAATTNYEAASATATVTIGKATAVLQWSAPSAIQYGTPLGAAELNATANVPGTFAYAPGAGTVLAVGASHLLSATFTPADGANVVGGSVSTAITVIPAPLTIRADDAFKAFGAPVPAFSVSASGFVNGDSYAVLAGTLSFSTTATPQSAVGVYPIVPSGVTASNYAITFVSGTLTVVPGAVAVNVATAPVPSGMNQPMTFTATVAAMAPAIGTPSGTVRFFDGSALLASRTLSGGVATLTTAGLAPGTRIITVQYDGDASFSPGTGEAFHFINDASGTPALTVTSSRNPSTPGQSVTLTANVSMPAGSVNGLVQFYSGGTLLGSGTISAGRATFTTTAFGNGSHAITALYTGGPTAPPSRSAVFVQAVGPGNWKNKSTTMTLTSSSNPSALGEGIVFTARVTGSIATMPSGRILIMVDGMPVGDPSGIVVTPVSGSTAQVTLSLSTLPGGGHTVTATYLGESTYKGSTASLMQQVN
jgi:hypothetical protein